MDNPKSYQELQKKINELEKENEQLKEKAIENKRLRQKTNKLIADLKERGKELSCIYKISHLVEKENQLSKIIQGTANILSESWQYPEITYASISLDGQKYKTDNYEETKWNQRSDLLVSGKQAGFVEVGYLEKTSEEAEDPFLQEERNLLDAVSERLGRIIERKQAQIDLKKERNYLKTLIETSPVAITKVDREGKIVYANNEAEKVLDLKKSDIEDRTYDHKDWQIKDFNGNQFPNEKLPFEIVRKTKEPVYDVRHTIETSEEEIKYLTINAAPLLDKNDNFEGMVSVIQDITKVKKRREKIDQHKKELQGYKNRLESTMKIGNLAWWEMDVNNGEVIFNPKKAEMLGYEPDKFSHYQDFMELLHPDDYDRAMQAMRDHFKGNRSVYKVDYRIKTKSGEYRWFHDVGGITSRDKSGKPKKVTGVVVDITDRKKVEESLKASEELNKSIIENSKDCIKILDKDGTLKFMSKGGQDLLEIEDVNSVLNESWIEFWKGKYQEKAHSAIQKALTGKVGYFEGYCPTTKGTPKWWGVQISPIYDSEGHIKQLLSVSRDITERKKSEQEKDRLTKELKRKNKELKQILYATSHDLRTPLVNIKGFNKELEESIKSLNNILKGKDIPEEVQEKLEYIIRKDIPESMHFISSSASKMDQLLTGLLSLSRLGQKKLNIKKLNIEQILEEVTSNFEYEIKNKDVELEINELPDCAGDESQINQVFTNLISNALKYLAPERKGKITISGRKKGQWSQYSVEDNGVGIPEDQQNKIFNLFHQSDPNKDGIGLGLNIIKQIIDRHNGKINMQSKPGRGTKFTLIIPGKKSLISDKS